MGANAEAPADWTLDPLLAALPEEIQDLPAIKSLDKLEFASFDGLALQEAIWLRDLSNWARGKQLDDLSRAKRLFDWTVRNIQLEPGFYQPGMFENDRVSQMPWETLLFGEGTAMDRAWIFLLLARQQGLDAAMLGLGDPIDPAGNPPHPWLMAVLIEGKLYLFDPVAGLPIPAAGGVRLDAQGQLDIQPATLAEVVADPSLLRRMDVDADDTYPVVAADLEPCGGLARSLADVLVAAGATGRIPSGRKAEGRAHRVAHCPGRALEIAAPCDRR